MSQEQLVDEQALEGWLTEDYDYERPRRGQIREGEILTIEEDGVMVDVGLKRDGFVPRRDVERLGEEVSSQLEPGQEVVARVVKPEDREGKLVLSMYQARQEKDWVRAEELLESGEIWQGEIVDCNRGGLIAQFGHLRAFIPASHVWTFNRRGLSSEERQAKLEAYIGQEMPLKVIEVKRNRRRLILSERLAKRQMRRQNMERLLSQLVEGQLVRGTVTQLCNFGAFVDLGGAEGLIHISELAWRRVEHPSQVVQAGDELDVYVLRLEHEHKRIGLSLKRLQPSPWTLVDETYSIDQLVQGRVTKVVDFGAFVELPIGVEGLVHVSELGDPPPSDPNEAVQAGDELVLRILRIDSFRHRIGLSLKRVSEGEREEWLARQAKAEVTETGGADSSSSDSEEPSATVDEAKETTFDKVEQVGEEEFDRVSSPSLAQSGV